MRALAGRLRRCFALRFGLVALLGSILGTILSAFATDPLTAVLMRMEGIGNFASHPGIGTVLFPGFVVTALFFLFAFLSSRAIQNSSLDSLAEEQ